MGGWDVEYVIGDEGAVVEDVSWFSGQLSDFRCGIFKDGEHTRRILVSIEESDDRLYGRHAFRTEERRKRGGGWLHPVRGVGPPMGLQLLVAHASAQAVCGSRVAWVVSEAVA